MVEPEVAFMDLDGDMELAEDFLVYVVGARARSARRRSSRSSSATSTLLENVQKPFPRITYDEAIALLQQNGHARRVGRRLRRRRGDRASRSAFDRPVHGPPLPGRREGVLHEGATPPIRALALCVDVLAPEGYGEIIGGGQREDDLDDAREAQIAAHELPHEAFEWYLDLRRYGSVPHAGFGLGIERTVAWICGLHHVRETIPFPRMLERLTP